MGNIAPYSNEKNVQIAAMIDKRAPRLAQLIDCALEAIAGSFEATRTLVIEKKVVDAGPDHYARLTGAKRLLEFTLAGRSTPRAEDQEKPKLTLQELEELLRENGQLPPDSR
jgi:hypothetical protein